jgi:hypothetical protein
MKTFIVLLTILMTACVNLSEMTDEERLAYLDQQEEKSMVRQEALAEAKMDYYEKAAACENSGGFMIIQKSSLSRANSSSIADRFAYRHSRCTKW